MYHYNSALINILDYSHYPFDTFYRKSEDISTQLKNYFLILRKFILKKGIFSYPRKLYHNVNVYEVRDTNRMTVVKLYFSSIFLGHGKLITFLATEQDCAQCIVH